LNLRDPESMSLVIGNVLRYGVLTSGLVTFIGVLRLALTSSYSDISSMLVYNPDTIPHSIFSFTLGGLLTGLASFDPYSLIELGVILLIATPVSRVSISVFLFAAEKDRLYVLITAVVLTLLLFSMLVTPFIPGFHA
jgi:uncharacterized membrane protein